MSFADELKKAAKAGEVKRQKDPDYQQYNKGNVRWSDKVKGIKGAFKRLREEGILSKKSYTTEDEAIERMACCSTCTEGNSCPYCGCKIKAKRILKTENCPNPTTYPHLEKFPPKNFWGVTEDTTSVILPARNEKYLSSTVEHLLETSTGQIEILVGLDGTDLEWEYDNERVKIIKEPKPVGRRILANKLVHLSTGKFLFFTHAHCILDAAWDTKLKCVCDEGNIVSCIMDSINEKKWEPDGHRWLGNYLNKDFNWGWWENMIPSEQRVKVEQVMSFCAAAWMIHRETFLASKGHREGFGEHVHEELEWTCNILLTGGKILIRTDVNCAHLFRKEFPYENRDNYNVIRDLIRNIWSGKRKGKIKSMGDVVEEFRKKYEIIPGW